MQHHETQLNNGYLKGILMDGIRPFCYRLGIRSLLGFPDNALNKISFPAGLPLTGLKYMNPLLLTLNDIYQHRSMLDRPSYHYDEEPKGFTEAQDLSVYGINDHYSNRKRDREASDASETGDHRLDLQHDTKAVYNNPVSGPAEKDVQSGLISTSRDEGLTGTLSDNLSDNSYANASANASINPPPNANLSTNASPSADLSTNADAPIIQNRVPDDKTRPVNHATATGPLQAGAGKDSSPGQEASSGIIRAARDKDLPVALSDNLSDDSYANASANASINPPPNANLSANADPSADLSTNANVPIVQNRVPDGNTRPMNHATAAGPVQAGAGTGPSPGQGDSSAITRITLNAVDIVQSTTGPKTKKPDIPKSHSHLSGSIPANKPHAPSEKLSGKTEESPMDGFLKREVTPHYGSVTGPSAGNISHDTPGAVKDKTGPTRQVTINIPGVTKRDKTGLESFRGSEATTSPGKMGNTLRKGFTLNPPDQYNSHLPFSGIKERPKDNVLPINQGPYIAEKNLLYTNRGKLPVIKHPNLSVPASEASNDRSIIRKPEDAVSHKTGFSHPHKGVYHESVKGTETEPMVRIEQLRKALQDLQEMKKRLLLEKEKPVKEETKEQQPQRIRPPDVKPVIVVKGYQKPSRTTSAFWERSYLSHFHLKILR